MTTDNSVRIAELQKEVEAYISIGKNSIVYDFKEDNGSILLHTITVNQRHKQSFLFHTTTGQDKVDALSKLLQYVKSYKEKESSYTIQWSVKGDENLQTSYFSAKNILGALDKLYFDRDPNAITIFTISLNPIS